MFKDQFEVSKPQHLSLGSNLLDQLLGKEEEEKMDDFAELQKPQKQPESMKSSVSQRPMSKEQKKPKAGNRRSKNDPPVENKRKGHWILEQNKRYHWFLEIYHNHFIRKEMRRLDKIFKTMALFIGTREAEQCRSHHQKMQKKFHTFSNILLFLRQTHYGSNETAMILEDMNRCDVQQNGVLLDARELQNIDTPKLSSITLEFPEQQKENQIMVQSLLDFNSENLNSIQNLFDNGYEIQLDLNNILM